LFKNPITIETLIVIDAIAKQGTYAAAAEQLNKVPSALSYIIQKCEEELGVTLFQKQGRRSILTPAGKHLVTEGRQILSAVQQLADTTKTIANGWEPKIKIAIDSLIDPLPVFEIIQQFLLDHPTVEIDIREEVLHGAWEVLLNDDVDLVIGAPGPVPQHKGLRYEPYLSFDAVFAVSPKHPLAKFTQPIRHDIIANYCTVVVHDTARSAIPWTAGILAKSQFFYVPTVEYKIKAQLAGIGCGFLPRSRIKHYLNTGQLVELQLSPAPQPIQSYLAWKIVNQGKALATLRRLLLTLIHQ
jgi:DNA-binding transcriptional LysR family regulator